MILNKHKQKVIVLVIVSLLITILGFVQNVYAQGIEISPDPSIVNIRPITIPLFISFEQARNFSVISYALVALSFVFVGILTYWIFKIIQNAVAIISSEGDAAKVSEATKKIQAIFIGIATLFLFVAAFALVGAFLNLGNFLEWPKKFSICSTGEFYITKALELNTATEEEIDRACFGT